MGINKLLLQNQILLLLKMFTYDSRTTEFVILNAFSNILTKRRETEKTIAVVNKNKLKRYNIKWSCVEGVLKY